jgi:hypothetical protein
MKMRKLEAGSSSCGTGCINLIARVRWQFEVASAFLSFRNGTSTCCAGSSTSLTWPLSVTNGSRCHCRPCATRVEPDGRWPTYAEYRGRTWFRMEQPGASRWNTVRVLRVLSWWEAAG